MSWNPDRLVGEFEPPESVRPTVETNGPIAAIGTPTALDRFERRLKSRLSATPDRIGVVTGTPGELRWVEGTDARRYLEAVGRPSH